MRVSAQNRMVILAAAGLFKPRVLRRTRMMDAGKVLSQISNRNIAVAKNGPLCDFLNDRLRAVLIPVERPNNVVPAFGLVPPLDAKRLENEKRKEIRYPRRHSLLDSSLI